MPATEPNFDLEEALLASGVTYVIGCDEVGRGAIAGPVAVGLCAVDGTVGPFPVGIRDSKLLSEKRRGILEPLARQWARHSAVGLASSFEVDEVGIIAALGLAGKRALLQLHEAGVDINRSIVLLDGAHDWLSPALGSPVAVTTRVKADRDCASVAAASVIAKVFRDQLMVEAHAAAPDYGWGSNKGYGSAGHFAAIAALGANDFHRHSWLHERAEVPSGRSEVPTGTVRIA